MKLIAILVCLSGLLDAATYRINGFVSGTPSVTVTLSGGASASMVTVSNGSYYFLNLADNKTYTITPQKAGYTFEPASITVSFTATASGASITGINFIATASNPPAAHSVTLSWNASTSPSISGYKVYRGTASGGPYTQVATGLTSTSYLDNAVSAGATYFYVTTAYNTDGESVYSNEAAAVVPTP